MRTIGNLLGGDSSIVDDKMDEIYNLEEKLAKVGYRAFSHDVMAAILVFQNNETAAMLVYQENPLGV